MTRMSATARSGGGIRGIMNRDAWPEYVPGRMKRQDTMTDQDVFLTHQGFRLRTVNATRYVTPLREGGSLPALMEADDDGLYVVKLRGAAQGAKTLVAELVAGEIGRTLGLHVPELVVIDLPAALTLGEPDPEIKGPLDRASGRTWDSISCPARSPSTSRCGTRSTPCWRLTSSGSTP